MGTHRTLILLVIFAACLAAVDPFANQTVEKSAEDLHASENVYIRCVIDAWRASNIVPVPPIILGADPKKSEVMKSRAIAQLNSVIFNVDTDLHTLLLMDLRDERSRERMLMVQEKINRVRTALIDAEKAGIEVTHKDHK